VLEVVPVAFDVLPVLGYPDRLVADMAAADTVEVATSFSRKIQNSSTV
jgi:hypothetical protein